MYFKIFWGVLNRRITGLHSALWFSVLFEVYTVFPSVHANIGQRIFFVHYYYYIQSFQ